MKKTIILLSILTSITCLVFFLVKKEKLNEDRFAKAQERISTKQSPYNYLLAMRTFPDEKFDHKQFKKVIENERLNLSTKKASAKFDEPWTTQGPANIGARVATIAVHPQNEDIILIGYAFGGIYKTVDAGETWYPVFDNETSLSLSDIVFDTNNPNIVWAGTGDNSIPFAAHVGDGIYKSEDGGETWQNVGLNQQGIVSKVIVHPSNSDIIYAACMGLPMERNQQRGLYKSTDGGNNWSQILFIDEQTGVLDIYMNKDNPEQLYASGWARIRTNAESFMGADSNHIYKTLDGGETWQNITESDAPETSRKMTFTVDENDFNRIIAIFLNNSYNADGYFNSEDGGETWSFSNVYLSYSSFGWYFDKLLFNPENNNEFYRLSVNMYLVDNNSESYIGSSSGDWITNYHPDTHDIHFLSDGSYLLATDGGLYKKEPNKTTYDKIESNTTSQFYRVAYNPRDPSSYQGGLQDNNCAKGNADAVDNWYRFSGGDGFQLYYHPTQNYYFTESQVGNINMMEGTEENSFYLDGMYVPDYTNGLNTNWNTPYVFTKSDPLLMYTGGESVFRVDWNDATFFGGKDVEEISPRLTNADLVDAPSTTRSITSLDVSTINEQIIYAGTGGGFAWRTLNSGNTWDKIDAGLPVRFISSMKASPSNENTVYVTHSGYRSNEYIPHVHRSDDNGDTWVDISANLPQAGINDIYVMPNHADSVLFVGTDIGVYATLNAGESWERLGNNMPFVPAMDLEFNPVEKTIFVGTFAKSILSYPVDSLIEIEEINDDLACANVADQIIINVNQQAFCEGEEIKLNITHNLIDINASLEITLGNQTESYTLSGNGVRNLSLVAPQVNCNQIFAFNYVIKCGATNTEVDANEVPFTVFEEITAELITNDDCTVELVNNCDDNTINWSVDIDNNGTEDFSGTGSTPTLNSNDEGMVTFTVSNNSSVCNDYTISTSYDCNTTTNTEELLNNNITIYPTILNANNAVINIDGLNMVNGNFSLYDLSGKKLFATSLNSPTESIILPQLTSGVYFVNIEQNGKQFKQKVTVL